MSSHDLEMIIELISPSHGDSVPVFHPEFGRFMLEATPGKPWGIGIKDLLDVEPNMKWRLVKVDMVCVDVGADSSIGGSSQKTTWKPVNTQSH